METREKGLLAAEVYGKIFADMRSVIQGATAPMRRNGLFTRERIYSESIYAKTLSHQPIKKQALWFIVPSAFSRRKNFDLGKVGALL